jgi:hypothetical protein
MRHVLAAIAVLSACPVMAQDTCFVRADLEPIMHDQFGEDRVSVALDARGWLMEVWTNPDNGTWTVTITTPDGQACFAAYGSEYQAIATVPGVDG